MAPIPVDVHVSESMIVTLYEDSTGSGYATRVWDCSIGVSSWMVDSMLHMRGLLQGKRIVEIGAGTALCSLAIAAAEPEAIVTATELDEAALPLIRAAAEKMSSNSNRVDSESTFHVARLDIVADEALAPLPACDLLIASDVCYTSELVVALARRCVHVLTRSPTARVLIADPGRPAHQEFMDALNQAGYSTVPQDMSAAPSFGAWLRDEAASRILLLRVEDDARTFGLSSVPGMC